MTATASLEDYIKQFKQDYKKYLSSDTGSVSSIDTDELLSDLSSETLSNTSRVPKGSIKSISSLKKKKTKVSQPSHLKPLHSTPLKMIQEEEEFYESHYKLSDFMPNNQKDISEYLPKARAAKNKRVEEILASLDVESENMSIISSVDTEALLLSSDEEEYDQRKKKKPKVVLDRLEKYNTSPLKIIKKQENLAKTVEKTKTPNLSLAKSQVLSVFPRKLTMETLSLSVGSLKKPSKSRTAYTPPSSFSSVAPPVQKNTKKLKICTCILSGSIYSHFSNCSPAVVWAEIDKVKILPKKRRMSMLESVILIQRAFREHLSTKKYYRMKKTERIDPEKASKTLKDASKELETLKFLASDRSSDVYLKNESYDISDVDTEELLNSSFSSILSRN